MYWDLLTIGTIYVSSETAHIVFDATTCKLHVVMSNKNKLE